MKPYAPLHNVVFLFASRDNVCTVALIEVWQYDCMCGVIWVLMRSFKVPAIVPLDQSVPPSSIQTK